MAQSDGSEGLEMQLVSSWDGWDQWGDLSFAFYDAVLKVDIGPIKAGTRVSSVELDYEKGIVNVFADAANEPDPRYTGKLLLSVA